MNRIKKYNEVLGLTKSVNAEELKVLYRQRAKELHPDRNKNHASHDQFVLLTEAYEFYHQLLSKFSHKEKSTVFNSKKYPTRYYKETWNVKKRSAARKRAAKETKMKYEEYERRGYNKWFDRFFLVFEVIKFIQALAMLIVLPLFMYWVDHMRGLIIALLVLCITYRLWSRAITRFFPGSK